MKNLNKALLGLFALQAGVAVAVTDTEDYYKCENKVSGTPWDYGTIPSWCDASSFGDAAQIKADFYEITFNANEVEETERDRYMQQMFPVLRDAAEYYFDTRLPGASMTEKSAWVHAVMSTASVETKWSQYRDALDGHIKMIRGDLGHGHGMMQIDDRWHFTAIEEGKGVNIFENITYAFDILYNGWKYSVAQDCVSDASDWEARSRSAYSAYNGGPNDWCRWNDQPGEYVQDTNFIAHYGARAWEDHVADKNAKAALDASCYMEEGSACSDSEPPESAAGLRIGQFDSGSIYGLLDAIDGERLEYIRGPENAYEAATRFLELERDGDWVKVELMKYNDTTETPLIGWVLDTGTITWTDVKAVGALSADFPATVATLFDEIDGSGIEFVRSFTNAWNPADRVVLLERDGDWAKVEILRYADVDETPIIGWVFDGGDFDWIEGEPVLDQLVGEYISGSVYALLDEIDGTRLEYIRGPENAYEQATRMLLLERDGDWVKVELMKFNDTAEIPLIGWVKDAGAIGWTEVNAVGSLKEDFGATILELRSDINGDALGQYIRSYSNAWNPADRVALLERDEESGWIKVEILRYLDKDETPNIGWVEEGDNFAWLGGIARDEGPTLAEIWENQYLSIPSGETCIHEAGVFHCVKDAQDKVCLNEMLARETEETPLVVSEEDAANREVAIIDRLECLSFVMGAQQVGDAIKTIDSMTVFATLDAAIASSNMPEMSVFAENSMTNSGDVFQVLDVVVLDQFEHNVFYKILNAEQVGYIYAGNNSLSLIDSVEHDELAQESILIPQAGDTIVINQADGIVLRDDTDVSGKPQALVAFGKEVLVEETIVVGETSRVYYKVLYQNVYGYLYGGMLAPEITLQEWASYTVPTVEPEVPVITDPDDKEVEVKPISEGGSFWSLLMFALVVPFRARMQRKS